MKNDRPVRSSLTIVGAGMSKESLTEFFCEMICCWLLAVGTAALQNVQLAYPVSYFAILWQTAVSIAVLALFSRRWFVLLITTVQLLLLSLLAMLLFQLPLAQFFTNASDFIAWWFAGMPEDSDWFTEAGMTVVHVLLNVGISCLMFFVVRLSRNALPPMALCVAILIAVMALGDTENNAFAVAAYLAGCCTLISRDHYSGRRLFSGREKYRPMGNRWLPCVVAGSISVIVAAGLFFLLPQDTINLRTRLCSYLTADFQTLIDWFPTEQKSTDQITLKDLGLQTYNTRIGGDLELDKEEAALLAVTDGDSSTFLRVTTYNTYTGYLWKNRFKTGYRINGPWKQTQLQQMGSIGMDSEKAVKNLEEIEDIIEEKSLTVTLSQETPFLLSKELLTGYTENTRVKNPVVHNANGELLSYFGLPEGYSYTMTYTNIPALEHATEDELYVLQAFSRDSADPFADDIEAQQAFLALPDDYSPQAAAIADEISIQCSSTLEQAITLAEYFTIDRGYSYTDKPGKIRSGEDVVEKLLQTKKGHCVYYATAVATMARSIGIPSRLAAGYRTVRSEELDAYVVSSNEPYAWVECYIRGLGWVPLDPTPRQKSTRVVTVEKPVYQPIEEPMPNQEQDTPPDEDQPDTDRMLVQPKALAVGLPLLLLLLLLVVRTLLADRAYRPENARRLFKSRRRRCQFYYQDILRQLECYRQPLSFGETLWEWLERLRPQLGDEQTDTLRQVLLPALAMQYGDRTPTEEEIDALAQQHAALESRLHERLSIIPYILYRRVLLPVMSPAVLRYPQEPAEEETTAVDAPQ